MSEKNYLISKGLREIAGLGGNLAHNVRPVRTGGSLLDVTPRALASRQLTRQQAASARKANVQHAKKGLIRYGGPGQKVVGPVVNPMVQATTRATRGWL